MRYIGLTSTIADGNMSFRYGATTAVLESQKHFLDSHNLPFVRSVMMESDHGDIITVVDEQTNRSHFGSTDSLPGDVLITQLPHTPLLLTTADCLPIILFDETTYTLALMHLSRHTFCLNLIAKTIAVLEATFAVASSGLKVYIGPHIHKASYSFPLPLAETHEALLPYIHFTNTTAHIDLTRAVTDSFMAIGIPQDNFEISPIDTYLSNNHFSHVRSTKASEPEGRLMTAASIAGFSH